MAHEVWKDIEGYEGLYQISNLGNVRSINYNKHRHYHKGQGVRILIPIINNMGYYYVNLYKGNGSGYKRFLVHRLVATMFLENPEDKPFVDHIDTNPLNNNLENLRWVTAKENSNNPQTKIHHKESLRNYTASEYALEKAHEASRKPVQMIEPKSGRVLMTFRSISDASRKTDILVQTICGVLKGKGKTAGGFIWKYCEREIEKTEMYGT